MNRRLQQLCAFALLSACGCALFGVKDNGLTESRESLNPQQIAEFENDVPVRNIVRLDASIMSALTTDKRIRELVWVELDESGLMSPEDRRRLNQSGLRVGVSGGVLPWALESLRKGERIDRNPEQSARPQSRLDSHGIAYGSHVAIPEGNSSLIELPVDGNSLIIPADQIAGMKNGRELVNARRVIELTPIEYGNGWVVIRFRPQIHHGTVTTRFDIAAGRGQMPVRQRIQQLYEQQFQLKLHAGETVVIGHLQQQDWTVGRLLFQSDSLTAGSERLIALHLADIEQVAGQKSLHVSYSKY